jgi:hypothetical protein
MARKKMPEQIIRLLGEYAGHVRIFSFAEKDRQGIYIEIINKTSKDPDVDLRVAFIKESDGVK